MKTISSILLVFISFYSITQTLQDSLVGYYKLDGIAADSSGNGNHGTIIGTTAPFTDRFGNPNGAMYFNGTGYINAGNPSAYQIQDDITLQAWIYILDSVADWATIISKWNDYSWNGYYFGLNPDQGKVRFNVGSANIDGSPMELIQWTHLTAVYDMNQIKIYKNGVLNSLTTTSAPIANTPDDFLIGAQADITGSFSYLHGALDDVMIHHRALSESEIMSIFNTGAVNPLDAELPFSLFPNPVISEMTIQFANNQNRKIILYNATGQIVKTIKSSSDTEVINISLLEQGLYYLHVNDGNGLSGKKIIKL